MAKTINSHYKLPDKTKKENMLIRKTINPIINQNKMMFDIVCKSPFILPISPFIIANSYNCNSGIDKPDLSTKSLYC
ncbi:unnamed protein product [marine sediment metagenome]|uniref:Uncharacterized protein n=1 Tax=marine sediment metagenome TaxID=412755 RepID=X1V7S5_9ZZZZ